MALGLLCSGKLDSSLDTLASEKQYAASHLTTW